MCKLSGAVIRLQASVTDQDIANRSHANTSLQHAILVENVNKAILSPDDDDIQIVCGLLMPGFE